MPINAEITLLETDLMLAGRVGLAPLKYSSSTSSPAWLTRRLCSLGRLAARSSAASKRKSIAASALWAFTGAVRKAPALTAKVTSAISVSFLVGELERVGMAESAQSNAAPLYAIRQVNDP